MNQRDCGHSTTQKKQIYYTGATEKNGITMKSTTMTAIG